MKKIVFIALFVALFVSCADNDHPNFHYEVLPIEEATIPASFELNETYDITLKFNLPNGCHHFHSLYYRYDDDKRIVAVYSIVEENIACTEALVSKEHTFQVIATQEEDYVFKIWKGLDDNDEDIFEDIIVPVTEPSNQV